MSNKFEYIAGRYYSISMKILKIVFICQFTGLVNVIETINLIPFFVNQKKNINITPQHTTGYLTTAVSTSQPPQSPPPRLLLKLFFLLLAQAPDLLTTPMNSSSFNSSIAFEA
jgi:hypothetical protein